MGGDRRSWPGGDHNRLVDGASPSPALRRQRGAAACQRAGTPPKAEPVASLWPASAQRWKPAPLTPFHRMSGAFRMRLTLTPSAVIAMRKAGRFVIECVALLLTLMVLGTMMLGG